MAILFAIAFLSLPVIGVVLYLRLVHRLREAGCEKSLSVSYFINFAGYGAILMMVVSIFFGQWSGMHSVAFLALVALALPTMLFFAIRGFRSRTQSKFHKTTFLLSACFPVAMMLLVAAVHIAPRY